MFEKMSINAKVSAMSIDVRQSIQGSLQLSVKVSVNMSKKCLSEVSAVSINVRKVSEGKSVRIAAQECQLSPLVKSAQGENFCDHCTGF